MEQKTNFQLVKNVLDQLQNDVEGVYGDRTDKIINSEMSNLTAAYGNLRDPNQAPIDYSKAETRFAYVYTYVATHADFMYQILNRVSKLLKSTVFSNEKIVVSCLGGGPGSEFVGLLQFLSEQETKIKTLTTYLCDREQAWADCWTEIGEEIPHVQHLNTNFQSLDVTNPDSWSKQKKFLSADLFLSNYFISEIARLGDAADSFWSEIATKSKTGAVMLIIDNAHTYFSDFVNKKIIANSWDVLDKESVALTPSIREEKKDLGKHFETHARSPKLTGQIDYWVLIRK